MTAPVAKALMQTIPIELLRGTANCVCLSGDGKVVTGDRASNGVSAYWTQSSGLQDMTLPSNGVGWSFFRRLSFDGSVITGSGAMQGSLYEAAWTWRRGQSFQVIRGTGSNTSDYENIGVAPDGSFTLREVDNHSGGSSRVYRDYQGGPTVLWVDAALTGIAGIQGASEDASVLFGRQNYSATQTSIPCYWNSTGYPIFCPAFINARPAIPFYCNKNGQFIVGYADLSYNIPNYGPATQAFRWNTATNAVDYYLPAGFTTAEATFISPDGNILCLDGYLSSNQFKAGLIDSTNAIQAAKGLQDIGTWLVANQYMSGTDLQKGTNFQILGMSDNNSTVVGIYTDKTNTVRSFLAGKLIYTTVPPISLNP